MAFLGVVGTTSPRTRFVVYSRGTGGGWTEADYRVRWTNALESRFPALSSRVTTMAVPGGVADGNFRKPEAGEAMHQLVASLLGLPTND